MRRRMPDGSYTEDANEYGDAWTSLGRKTCEALGKGRAFGFDPDIQISFDDVYESTLTLPVWVAERTIELHGLERRPAVNDQNPLWLDDKLQFARLLCELAATQPDMNLIETADSMDLSMDEVSTLFDRAHKVWEEAKPEPASELQRLEAAFAEAGGRGVELAERIDELRKQANSGPHIEKVLALSTAHIPNADPDLGKFGGLRAASFEYGFVVWVSEPGDGVPEWITPAMKLAYDNGCTLILFDRDCNEDPDLPTWDW